MPNLVQIVDSALASATLRSGLHLACRPGCTQCCHGVFAISHQDSYRLRTGLEALTHTDPDRAARLGARVADSLARLTPMFPGDPTTGILAKGEDATQAFEDFANDERCPVLDPQTGTCDLYEHRPMLCRTFGPPARTEEGHLAHCELCYTQATVQEIATCELDPLLPETIRASDEAFNAAHRLSGETIVAYALRSY
ncbi:MAG TPA: YkgJ family cysteine cluster protein [Acidobacteriaceae bacterium]|nr:YkgJ family cysteine cluster protein [Acidobacteriaceae bacterium]